MEVMNGSIMETEQQTQLSGDSSSSPIGSMNTAVISSAPVSVSAAPAQALPSLLGNGPSVTNPVAAQPPPL